MAENVKDAALEAKLEAEFLEAMNKALSNAPDVVKMASLKKVAKVVPQTATKPKAKNQPKVENKVKPKIEPNVEQKQEVKVSTKVESVVENDKPRKKRKYKLPDHNHNGHRERFKSRYHNVTNLQGFADHEVLELLLYYAIPYQNTNGVAHELLKRFGSLSQVLEADYNDLQSVKGVGTHVATFLTVLPQIAGRYVNDRWRDEKIFSSSTELCRYAIGLFIGCSNEAFYVICLNAKNQIVRNVLIAEGTVGKVNISMSKVVEEVVKSGGRAVVLAHNHPGGMAKPSGADLAVTRECVKALRYLEIPVLDHIIVSGDSTVSFKEKGYMTAVLQGIAREDSALAKM